MVGLKRYGKTQTAHLQDLGLLGPDFTVGHGVWLDHDDMQRLGDHGASVAHNPGSNMRLGNGLADVRGMLERKVNVGIGTDGANCSDNLNMYESMRLASMVSKMQGPDTDRWLTTGEVFAAATEGSARRSASATGSAASRPATRPTSCSSTSHNVNWMPFNNRGQPARPYRGRRGGPFGDGRRRAWWSRTARVDRRRHGGAGAARRGDARAARRRDPARTSNCSSRSSRSSTASARASPRCRITSTASAADIMGIRTGRG